MAEGNTAELHKNKYYFVYINPCLDNQIANEYWEKKLKKFDFKSIQNDNYRLQDFIRDKYERKKWINKKKKDPMTLIVEREDESEEEDEGEDEAEVEEEDEFQEVEETPEIGQNNQKHFETNNQENKQNSNLVNFGTGSSMNNNNMTIGTQQINNMIVINNNNQINQPPGQIGGVGNNQNLLEVFSPETQLDMQRNNLVNNLQDAYNKPNNNLSSNPNNNYPSNMNQNKGAYGMNNNMYGNAYTQPNQNNLLNNMGMMGMNMNNNMGMMGMNMNNNMGMMGMNMNNNMGMMGMNMNNNMAMMGNSMGNNIGLNMQNNNNPIYPQTQSTFNIELYNKTKNDSNTNQNYNTNYNNNSNFTNSNSRRMKDNDPFKNLVSFK